MHTQGLLGGNAGIPFSKTFAALTVGLVMATACASETDDGAFPPGTEEGEAGTADGTTTTEPTTTTTEPTTTTYCGVLPNDLGNVGEMFAGASATGNVCVAVAADQVDGGAWIVEDSSDIGGESRVFVGLG